MLSSVWGLWRSRKEKGFHVHHAFICSSSPCNQTFPALYHLWNEGRLPKGAKIVGYARTKMEPDDFHKRTTAYIKNAKEERIAEFNQTTSYVSGGYEDAASFQNLNKYLESIEEGYQKEGHNRLYYLALPPSVFIPVTQNLKKYVYAANGRNRIVIEKPFGKDLDSCVKLLSAVKENWAEEETYRIDHYLGKEMVKNIFILRFANLAFSSLWDKNSVSNVQISFKEPFGTEGRGGYFDEFGIIRDILQNRELAGYSHTRDS